MMEPRYERLHDTDAAIESAAEEIGNYGHGGGRYRSEIRSSLAAQVLIYFNILLSIVYLFIVGGLIIYKNHTYKYKSTIQPVACVPAVIIWAGVEVLRLYFGFTGNLLEMAPQMTAFLLMTVFPQSLLVIYLLALQEYVFPADKALGGIMLVVLFAEMIAGYGAVRAITTKRTAQFYRVARQHAAAPSGTRIPARDHQD